MKTIALKENVVATYKAYGLSSFRSIPQMKRLSEEQLFNMEVVGNVLPFKVNDYVINELINWDNVPNDPIFRLTFPQKEMLHPLQFAQMELALKHGAGKQEIKQIADSIRLQLNPHPAGQKEYNVPSLFGKKLHGIQHKYGQTVLFFPAQGQTCHAYCTFCFRWPQFVGMEGMKFAMKETEQLIDYLRAHPEVTDVLFTGGDPMVMRSKILRGYIEPLIKANLPNLKTIRIGTKAFAYWPYRFTTDDDADDLLQLFSEVAEHGIHLALMAHFSHAVELSTSAVGDAIAKIRSCGVEIRTQSPILKHINDSPAIWADMWQKQVALGCIPYYMFVARDTGAKEYFEIPLVRAWEIFRAAYQKVSGVCRTVRGPSMSCTPGKIQVLGVSEVPALTGKQKVITLRFLQGRNPDWVGRPFFAEYNPKATWIDELKPAFGEEKFFFEE
jgi:KamA family protein